MAGVSAGKWANYEVGASGGAVALLSGIFRGGTAKAAFSGLLHRWEKVRKFAGHSAR